MSKTLVNSSVDEHDTLDNIRWSNLKWSEYGNMWFILKFKKFIQIAIILKTSLFKILSL